MASFLWQVLRHPELFIITVNKKSAIQKLHITSADEHNSRMMHIISKTNEQHARKNEDFHTTASSDEVEYLRFCVYS